MKQNPLSSANVQLLLLLLASPLLLASNASSHLRASIISTTTTAPATIAIFGRSLQTEEDCTETCCSATFPSTVDAALNCTLCIDTAVDDVAPAGPFDALADWMKIILIIVLIGFSATFSGLTLGLMGLDKTGLEIVMNSDDPVNKQLASKIYPLRKNGNLLLCTLLLGNTAVNALLSIFMADFTGGMLGFLMSTFLILIFGEISPQAICSRYALQIGSRVVPLVRVIVVLLYPITKPLAWTLDKALGQELATTYSGAELLKLLEIHVQENAMDPDTANTMGGALRYKDLSVHEVMTPLENVFMLSIEDKLNFETIAKIFKTGYSRIPVYEVSRNNVIGLLMVKDLIFVDPEDETRIRDFIEIMGRSFHICWPDDKLGEILRALKAGKSHMAIVQDVNNDDSDADPFYEIKGIITLEDIIEEILGDEIVDETDAFLDGTHSVKLDREGAFEFARLRLLHNKIVDETLSLDETRAVTAHLMKNYPHVVAMLSESQLFSLIAETAVSDLPTAPHEVGQDLPSELLYEKGVQNDVCTLILSGKVTVLVGEDGFRSDVSSWSLLGAKALDDVAYTPDFTAFVSSGPCRCIRFSRSRFIAAQDTSTVQKIHPPAPSTADNSLDKSEATRKAKLMAAMRAVDGGSANGGSSKRILTATIGKVGSGDTEDGTEKPTSSDPSSGSNGKS